MRNPEYIGDGVYVYFSGYDYQISVNDHRNAPVVFMEPEIVDRLYEFKKRIEESKKIDRETE
jgi:hypothetical protein